MLNGDARDSLSFGRRQFLQASAAGLAAAAASSAIGSTAINAKPAKGRSVIFILMTGGPSQLETFDPKPDAPVDVRGPFRAIQTSVPGIRIGECFPRLAKRAEKFSIIRTLNHDALPIHETGLQLIQTGRLAEPEMEFPHAGAVAGEVLGDRCWTRVPYSWGLGDTGVDVPKGCSEAWLKRRGPSFDLVSYRGGREGIRSQSKFKQLATEHNDLCGLTSSWRRDPTVVEPWHNAIRLMFERAVQLVEQGNANRFVSINMFHSVFDQLSWDMHASSKRLWVSTETYRNVLCPIFDLCFSNLLDDLSDRGLLERTLVVAVGEMGRTPRMNSCGGRDHWTRCWSALVAGGGTQGGRVVGTSGAVAGEPVDRPVSPAELVATIYHSLGIDPARTIERPDGTTIPLVIADPIAELL